MNKIIQDPTGLQLIPMTPAEVLAAAQDGNREAIRELVIAKGGWSALTAGQKDAVLELLTGIPASL